MSLKNRLFNTNERPSSDPVHHMRWTSSPDGRSRYPRSLRLQLMLWYGGLVAVSLIVFGILVYLLAVDAVYQEAQNAVNAETRVALLNIEQTLVSNSQSWHSGLTLNAIDRHIDPSIGVEVVDTHGQVLYRSSDQFVDILPASRDLVQATRAGERPPLTRIAIQQIPALVQASPIYAPPANADGRGGAQGPIIGTLLVAKSLEDATSTLLLLQTLLLLAGLTALTIALAGGWAITANVLRPLAEIVKTARAIATTARGTHVGNLNQRVRRPRGHDELMQVVDTFNEMLAALERATQAQHRFIADASHELRAPLTTVQGNLAFLLRHLDEIPLDERRTMLKDAHGETLRLARLVDELLLLARADTDNDYKPAITEKLTLEAKKSAHERPVELDRALLQLVRQLRGRLNMDGSRLKLEIGHIEPVRVYGDEEKLRRVMLILLDNALKYTPADDDKEPGCVTVALERDGKDAVLHVKDTGIGIDPSDLPHIFERFYRADRARSRQGTGLGLSIAHTLIEQAGGRIAAQSTPGDGSTFSVWLPLVK